MNDRYLKFFKFEISGQEEEEEEKLRSQFYVTLVMHACFRICPVLVSIASPSSHASPASCSSLPLPSLLSFLIPGHTYTYGNSRSPC